MKYMKSIPGSFNKRSMSPKPQKHSLGPRAYWNTNSIPLVLPGSLPVCKPHFLHMFSGWYVWLLSLKYNDLSNYNFLCLPTCTASLCLQNYFSVLVATFLISGRMLLEHASIIRMISGVSSLNTLWGSIFFQFSIVSYGLVFVWTLVSPRSMKTRLTCDTLCYL